MNGVVADNPILCSCQSFPQKLWLTQNRKWLTSPRAGPEAGPRCSGPAPLETRPLVTATTAELCPLPSVSSFHIRNVTTSSVLIAWDTDTETMVRPVMLRFHRYFALFSFTFFAHLFVRFGVYLPRTHGVFHAEMPHFHKNLISFLLNLTSWLRVFNSFICRATPT